MDNKKLFIGLAATMLLIGGVFAAGLMDKGMDRGGGPFGRCNMTAELGLDEDATDEEVSEALFQKRLSELGLTEDDSIKELRAALEIESKEHEKERLVQARKRLGLDPDATEEEVQEALEEQAGVDNGFRRGLLRGMGGGGRPGTMVETFGMGGLI